jgi:UDP-N-acetylglucosamine--N-acetylmuramyl-(pentapeptide) pyrophosphoryl-undecaprenol N-acetylglucosamine transferase
MKIVLTGGGTGGHIFPLVAVAKKMKEKYGQKIDLLFIGPNGDLEKEVMQEEGIRMKSVLSGKVRRYFSFLNFVDFFKIPLGFLKALWILLWEMPDAVFSKGGYASVPVVLAAWVYRIPVLIHESDAIPGIANRFLEKFSRRVAISYPSAEKFFRSSKVLLTGNPIREGIEQGDKKLASEKYNIRESKPTLLVLGGSQGSQKINQAITEALPNILETVQILHQTGKENFENVIHSAAKEGIKNGREGYTAVPFLNFEDMRNCLALADVAVSRAGANSIAELAANSIPSILIPLPTAANNHQRMNAYYLSEIGGAIALEESNLGEHIIIKKIQSILSDKETYQKMSESIHTFHHPDAIEKIIEGLEGMIPREV